jgi:hypothetical protein
LALQLEEVVKAKAKERMMSGKKADPTQKSAEGQKGETREEIAKMAGVIESLFENLNAAG